MSPRGRGTRTLTCHNRASSTFPRNSYRDATHVFTSPRAEQLHRAHTVRTSLLSGALGTRPEPASPHRPPGAGTLGDTFQCPVGWGWESGSSSGRDPSCPTTAHSAVPRVTASPQPRPELPGPQGARPAAPVARTPRGERHPRSATPGSRAAPSRCPLYGWTHPSITGRLPPPRGRREPRHRNTAPRPSRSTGPGSLTPARGPSAPAPPSFLSRCPPGFPEAPTAHFSISRAATFLFS